MLRRRHIAWDSAATRRTARLTFLACTMLVAALPSKAVDKSGVKPSAISVPSGPGSIEGLGESFEPTLSSGTASYQIGLTVPPGTTGHAPSLALGYNGGGSNGALGFGWSLGIPFVQRQTDKGIPLYLDAQNRKDDDGDRKVDEPDEVDMFMSNLTEELVPQADGYYRCEVEGSFIRYRRVGDHWEGNQPDGALLEFGLTAQARVSDADTGRVFRWLLERETDTNGNTIVYSYTSFPGEENLNRVYLAEIRYGPGAPPWDNFHFVAFEYEPRPDWFEDCRSGFAVRTGMRLKTIAVGTQGPTLEGHASGDFNGDGRTDYLNRKYRLAYEAHEHWSLLTSITFVGADNASTLPPAEFTYTACDPSEAISASGAIIGSTGTPVRVMDNPLVDLVDLNGDGLPDILETEEYPGPHTAYINKGEVDSGGGKAIQWASGVDVGGDQLAWNVNLAKAFGEIAHLADMDADGIADFVYATTYDVYYFPNQGDVSWGSRLTMNIDPASSAPPSPFSVDHVKTADVDFDKRMDVIQSIRVGDSADYRIWFNLGDQTFSRPVTTSPENTFMLSDTGVHIADFNGDRVPDIVRVRPAQLEVTTGLGYGNFAPLRAVPLPDYAPLDTLQVERARLEDVTGDGLVDLVIERAGPGQLWYWLNLGNYTLDTRKRITGLPTPVGPDAETRWADLNGNGSTDLVYADYYSEPRIQTVDIGRLIGCVPSPNLMLTVTNGIGRKTIIEYATSARFSLEDAAASAPWPDPLPFTVDVIARTTVDDSMGNQYVTDFAYHDGYYDGREREFRGFARAEQTELGDATAPTLVTRVNFDTGRDAEAMKSKLLRKTAMDEDGGVFWEEVIEWTVRTLMTGTDGKTVAYAHPASKTRDVLERGNGAPVQLKWEFEYDDYGNMTRQVEYGRMDDGWDDERVTETAYAAAGVSGLSAWILNAVVEKKITDEDGDVTVHRRNYYDGNGGLFEVSRGNPTKTEDWIRADEYVTSVRHDYDPFGNVTAVYDALYGAEPGHYRQFVYDGAFNTFTVEESVHTGTLMLRFSAMYDVGLGTVTSSTDYNGFTTHYGHDSFGRCISITKPPDVDTTEEYDYVIAYHLGGGKTINWIETRAREVDGGGTVDSRTFFDGLGRGLMTRAEGEEPGQVVVTEAVTFNARTLIIYGYLPYFQEQSSLDYTPPPTGSLFVEHVLDALGRPVRVNEPAGPDGSAYSTTEYGPLTKTVRDEEQTNPSSPHFGCAMRYIEDGLPDDQGKGRVREVHEIVNLSDTGEPLAQVVEWHTRFDFDLCDRLTGYTDAQGNQHIVERDGLGRILFKDDPDRGQTHYAYDAAGNLVQSVDAKAQVIRYAYDGINRLTAEYYGADKPEPDVEYHYDVPYGPLDRGSLWEAGFSARVAETILSDGAVASDDQDLNRDGRVDVADVVSAERQAVQRRKLGDPVTAENTAGQLAWVRDLSGEEHRSFDQRGREAWCIKRIIDTGPDDVQSFYRETQYDSMNRVTKMIFPDQTRLAYAYNSRGLIESIPGVIDRHDYTADGQRAVLVLACGVTTTYEYDQRLRLIRLHSLRERDNRVLQDLAYTYDGASNVLAIQDRRSEADLEAIGQELGIDPDPARIFRGSQSFQYDARYRLIEAANEAIFGSLSFRYDRTGNMLFKTAELLEPDPLMNLGAMTYGASMGAWGRVGRNPGDPPGPHALTGTASGAEGPMVISYDDNGNMTTDGGMTFTWDQKDRLVEVLSGSTDAEYAYDYNDARRKKVTRGLARSVSEDRTFYIDRASEVRTGRLMKYAHWGPTRVARSVATPHDSQEFLPSRFFLHDHLGSTAMALADDGTVMEQCAYYPYGYTRMACRTEAATSASNYGFTGMERDTESGLQYAEARYYDARFARFLTQDRMVADLASSNTVGLDEATVLPARLNGYTYCNNSPLNYTDPSGNITIFIPGTGCDNRQTFSPGGASQIAAALGDDRPDLKTGVWSGGITKYGRISGASDMAARIVWMLETGQVRKGEPINLVGHSHGGNVAKLVAAALANRGYEVANLVTINTPHGKSYSLSKNTQGLVQMGKIKNYVSLYREKDWLRKNAWISGTGTSGPDKDATANVVLPNLPYKFFRKGGLANHAIKNTEDDAVEALRARRAAAVSERSQRGDFDIRVSQSSQD